MILRCKIKNLISEKLRSLVFVVGMLSAQFGYSQINVMASPDHLKIDGIDTIGNIYLSVSGGVPPYNYTWTPGGGNTQDFAPAAKGDYTVSVDDAWNNLSTYHYSLGYKSTWKNFYNCISRNDSLIPNSTGGVNRSAISKNVLRPNTDGWMEMIYYPEFDLNVIGLVDTAMVANQGDWYDYDIAVHVSGGYLYATEGVNWYYLGPISYGDVVRIERTSNVFYVRQNNTVMFTLGGINQNMQVKGLFGSGGLINIGTSFSDTTKLYPLKLEVSLDHLKTDDVDSLGNIYLGITGGIAPYTVNWTPNNVSSQNNLNIPKGSYTATVIDSNNDTLIYSCSLGYKTDWTNFYGSMSRNDSLMSDNSSGYVNRSAVSNNILRPNVNGWVEMIVKPVNIPCVMGLLDSMIVANQGDNYDIDIGVHVTYGNAFYVWTGTYWSYIGTANNGDVLRIERTSNVFYVKQNGSVVYSQGGINKSLKVKGLIYYSSLVEIGTSFADSTSINPLTVIGMINPIDDNTASSSGAINMQVSGGASPYTYKWTNNGGVPITSKNRANLSKGTYELKVKDYRGDSVIHSYNVGYKARWDNFYGTSLSNDSLIVTTFSYPTDSFPTSRIIDTLAQDSSGWAEMVIRPFVAPYVVGFVSQVDPNYNGSIYDIDFAYHLTYGNELYCWDKGYWYYIGRASDGDVVRLDRDASSRYNLYWNDALMQSTDASNAPLQLKSQLVGPPYAPSWPAIISVGVGFSSGCMSFFPQSISIANSPVIITNGPVNTNLLCTVTGGLSPQTIVWSPNMYFTSPNNNTQFNTNVNVPVSTTYTATVTGKFGCKSYASISIYVLQAPYAVLKRNYDGGHYKITNNQIYFKYDGEYNSGQLTYKIYNNSNSEITGLPSLNKTIGDNRYNINLTSLNPPAGFYKLEVTNEKSEKFILKMSK